MATKKKNKSKKTVKKSAKKVVKKTVRKIAKKAVKKTVKRIKKHVLKLKRKPKAHRKYMGEMPTLRGLKNRSRVSVHIKKSRHKDVILILDFGSQYTQVIARRIRESKVYSKIVPYNISADAIKEEAPKGLILSGGPMSVYDKNAPMPKKEIFELGIPVLGVCYGL